MYKIIGADGKEYGPISGEQLKQWIAEGRANAQTKVLADGGTEWKSLVDFPELAATLPTTPPPMAAGIPPIPGASPLPHDVRERDYEIDIGDCVSRAWQLLTGPKMWLVIGGVAIWIGIQAGLSGFASIPFIGLLFSLASLVIGGPLTGGVYYFLLRCIRGEAADVGDIFAGFKHRFAQLFLGQLIMTLLVLAAMLPGIALLVAGMIPAFSHHDLEPVGIALVVVGAVAILLPAIYFSIGWMFTLPLIMDKRLDFWPAMQLSRKVVGRHWWMVLVVCIVAGTISVIGLCLCCIGVFFTLPLGLVVAMHAYEKMFSLNPVAASATLPISPQTHI